MKSVRTIRKVLLSLCVAAWVLNAAPAQAQGKAQGQYPQKAITFIIPYAPGGASDLFARGVVEIVAAKLGVPIMVVNKGGGGGALGLNDIATAKPDGYTIGTHVSLPFSKLLGVSRHNQHSIDMIGIINTDATLVVANGKKPWKNLREMVDYARTRPGEVTMCTPAKGSHQWIAAKVFEAGAKIKVQIVPEPESGGGIMAKVAGGHTDLAVSGLGNFQGQLFEDGTLRILGVLGPKRLEGRYQNVQTTKEQGFEMGNVPVLRSVLGPKGMPKPVLDKLIQVFGEAAQSEQYRKFLLPFDATPLWIPGEKAVRAYDEQERLARPVLEEAGLITK